MIFHLPIYIERPNAFLLDYNTFPAHINSTHRQNVLSHQWKRWKNEATIGRSNTKEMV